MSFLETMESSAEENQRLFVDLVKNLRRQCRLVIEKLHECDKSITSRNETMSAMREMLLSFTRKIPRKRDPDYNLSLLTASQLSEIQTAVKNVKKYLSSMIKVHQKTREEIAEATGLYRLFSEFYLDCRGAYSTLRPVYPPEEECTIDLEQFHIPQSIRKKVKKIKKLHRNLTYKAAGWDRVVKLLENKVNNLDKLDEYCTITASTRPQFRNIDDASTSSLEN